MVWTDLVVHMKSFGLRVLEDIYIYDLFIPFGTLYMIIMGEYNTISTIWNYVTNVSSYDEPRFLKLSAGIRLALT